MLYKVITFTILLIIIFVADINAFGSGSNTTREVVNRGVGLGSVIAVVASWSRNSSILWAILHGLLSWIYVIYFAITRKE